MKITNHKPLFFILIAFFFTAISFRSFAQTDEQIVTYFVKQQLEVSECQTVFNVFKIKNVTDQPYSIQVNFTIPAQWIILAERSYFLTVNPHQEISLPLRISPSVSAKGGVGYALNATVLSSDAKVFATKYCFLTIPRRTSLKADFTSRGYYIDHLYGRSSGAFHIANNGNCEKLLHIKFSINDDIIFSDYNYSDFSTDILLAPGQDTVVNFNMRYAQALDAIKYLNRPISVTVAADDTVFSRSAFLYYLDYRFDNYFSDEDMPLVIEASALDILSDKISYRFLVMGKLKFRQNRYFQYYYRTISAPLKDLPDYKRDEYFVKYYSDKHELTVGNYYENQYLTFFGPAVKYKYKFSNTTGMEFNSIDDIFSNHYFSSAKVYSKIRKVSFFGYYGKMINDTSYNNYADIYGSGFSFPFLRSSSVNSEFYYNRVTPDSTGKIYSGYATNISLSYSYNKNRFYSSLRYANPYFLGYFAGQTQWYNSFIHDFSSKYSILIKYNYFENKPASLYNDYSTGLKYYYHDIAASYRIRTTNISMFYMGPIFDYGSKNYYYSTRTSDLTIRSAKGEIGYRYAPNTFSLQAVNINIKAGYIEPVTYPDTIPSNYKSKSSVLSISATASGKRWGIFSLYYSGLYNMSMALNSFYSTAAGRYLYVMPYYRLTSSNQHFFYEIRLSYLNNFDLNSTRTSIMQMAGADFGGGWSARLQNNTNMQQQTDANGNLSRYTNNYMELVVRKVFHWNQPGQKYHTLKTVFYKDLNGDRIMGQNEPGVENVVIGIDNYAAVDTSYHYTGEIFGNVDLASNNSGLTVYSEIPEAKYSLRFKPTFDNSDGFNIVQNEQVVDLRRDTTVFIPFSERNKVYGKLIFNRSKRTSFQELSLDNVRISLTDSYGNIYYTLTDKTGSYEIFAPSSDYYTVQIVNNIWTYYFDLRQDKYIIKFNGYKTFEVNFEFDEKKREIKFDDVVDIDQITNPDNFKYEDVKQIKQVILRGSVKDEKSLMPVKATVEVFDVKRHDVVAKVMSGENNGNFFTTFIAGENYQLRISATDYWVFAEPIASDQLTTFETIDRDGLLLKKIISGAKMDTPNLTFASGQSDLTPEAKAELELLVSSMFNNENVKFYINGYCDSKEPNSANLSLKRALVVKQFFLERGLADNRFVIKGMGNENTVGSNITDNGRSKNRRVEVIIQ